MVLSGLVYIGLWAFAPIPVALGPGARWCCGGRGDVRLLPGDAAEGEGERLTHVRPRSADHVSVAGVKAFSAARRCPRMYRPAGAVPRAVVQSPSRSSRPMPFAPVNDIQLYYESDGEGLPVVFAHGRGGNHLSWWQQIPSFARHHRCIAFDHREFGRSRRAGRAGTRGLREGPAGPPRPSRHRAGGARGPVDGRRHLPRLRARASATRGGARPRRHQRRHRRPADPRGFSPQGAGLAGGGASPGDLGAFPLLGARARVPVHGDRPHEPAGAGIVPGVPHQRRRPAPRAPARLRRAHPGPGRRRGRRRDARCGETRTRVHPQSRVSRGRGCGALGHFEKPAEFNRLVLDFIERTVTPTARRFP